MTYSAGVEFLSDYRNKDRDPTNELVDELDTNRVLKEGDVYWQCECGHPLFFVMQEGVVCQGCGKTQSWDNDKD